MGWGEAKSEMNGDTPVTVDTCRVAAQIGLEKKKLKSLRVSNPLRHSQEVVVLIAAKT